MNTPASRNWWPRQPLSDGPAQSRPATAATRHLWGNGLSTDGHSAARDQLHERAGSSEAMGSVNLGYGNQHGAGDGTANGNGVGGEAPNLPANLATGDTSDSTQLTQLLDTLTAPGQQGLEQPFQDTAMSPNTMPYASAACILPACMLPEDNGSEDLPLISNRGNPTAPSAGNGVAALPTSCGPAPASASAHHDTLLIGSNTAGPVHLITGLAGLRLGSGPQSFQPCASWASQATCVMYVGVFLTPASREVLLSVVPPKHPCISADHMTLAYKPSIIQLLDYPLGVEVPLKILGHAADSRAQAAVADPPNWLPPTTSVSTHITISVAVGTKAVEAGHLVMDALQRTALTDPAGPSPAGAGAYVPMEEPLPLIGRLGVMVKSNGSSTCHVTTDRPDGVVLYHIEDLDKGGYVRIGPENLRLYHEKHRSLLGKQDPLSPIGLCPGSMIVDSSNQPSFLAQVGPTLLVLPPAVPLHGVVAPSDPASNVAASSVVCEHSLSAVQPSISRTRAPVLEHADSDAGSSSGSSSDVVQFKSALQIGDYVAVRPFVPTSDGGQLLQGFVKEFANDEPFQASGVLVVLSDNTIGFVTDVLDPAAPSDGQRTHHHGSSSNYSKAGGSMQQQLVTKASSSSGSNTPLSLPGAHRGDTLSEWALSALEASSSASGVGFAGRTVERAQHDLQLLTEFEALEQQYGEGLCNAILQDCSLDFEEAITLIRAQAGAQVNAPVSAAGTSSDAVVPTPTAPDCVGPGVDEDLAQQLALSLGLDGDSTLRLCRLAPQASAERVVDALYQHGGDVQKAADALLSESGASSTTSGLRSSTPADIPATLGSSGSAYAALGSKDSSLVLNALQLCSWFPHLSQDTAEMLLVEHGGDVDKVANHVSDMQASELRSRTAAQLSSVAACLAPSVDGPSSSVRQEQTQDFVTEEDQMAMLAALGVSAWPSTQQKYATVARNNVQPQNLSSPPPPPARSHQQPNSSPPRIAKQPMSSAVRSSSASSSKQLNTHSVGQGSQRRSRSASATASFGASVGRHVERREVEDPAERRAKEQAMIEADRLYTKSKKFIAASEIYMAAAQACLKAGNMEGYEEKKQAHEKAFKEGRAAFYEANGIAYKANNQKEQSWHCDLHGLGTTQALRKVATTLESLQAMDNPGGVVLTIVTGKGKHSEDNVPKIKINVMKFLEEKARQVLKETGRRWGVEWEVDRNNDGCVIVTIPGSGQS